MRCIASLAIISMLIAVFPGCGPRSEDSRLISNSGIFSALNRTQKVAQAQLIRHEGDGDDSEEMVDTVYLTTLFSLDNTTTVNTNLKLLNIASIEIKLYGVSFWVEEYANGIYGIDGHYYRFNVIPSELKPFFGERSEK